jgi:FAD/FMN-containing dehydrogenase/Fe-S oxidoreductase
LTDTKLRGISAATAAHLRAGIEGDVRLDEISRVLYANDASIYQMDAEGVVAPRNTKDVIHCVNTAKDNGFSLVPRGGGTSLAGQTVGASLHVDFSRHMRDIIELNTDERWVRVQPGVVLDELNAHLAPHGLQFGPDVSTSSRANLGGMIGNNSCGAHSILYGKTIDHVQELTVVLADGEVARFAPIDEDQRRRRSSGNGIEATLHRSLPGLLSANQEQIRTRFPHVMRRVSGYNLDALMSPAPFDLSRLVVGSEGTLCAVTEAKLGLVERPRHSIVVACHFAELAEAMEANLVALTTSPASSELMDRLLLDQTKDQLEYAPRRRFLVGDPEALLFVEYYGDSTERLRQLADDLEQQLRSNGLGYAYVRAQEVAEQKGMWDLRKAGLGLLMGMRGDPKPTSGIEDTCVPVKHLPEYVRRVAKLMAADQIPVTFYGHASVGVLHIRPVLDLKKPDGITTLRRFEEQISDWVLEFGGSMSAEHGDGLARSEWIEKMFGAQLVEAFAGVKKAFDPAGVFNPGKIVDAPKMDENLRYGEAYRSAPMETFFHFEEGSFQQAVEMCSGVGQCRKTLVGTMCPSFMATLDEQHSTRGRANALRAALDGRLASGLHGQDLHEVMDLCLECKACKAECPSSVDMAKLKYEYLAQRHERDGVPLRSRLFASIDVLNRWLSPFARLLNPLLQSRPNRWLMECLFGIDRRRKMPALAPQIFSDWFAKRPISTLQDRGTVVFYNDTFTEFNEPEVGQAAVHLLEAAGFRVVLPELRSCCGRPMISKGMLKQVKPRIAQNIADLSTYIERGWPIVGVEPSCLLTYRDDYIDLAPDRAAARRLADRIFMLDEFLATVEREEDGGLGYEFDPVATHVLLHGHCHQKALANTSDTSYLLGLPPGFQVEELASGCCGMAGSFGYEREHYDVSMEVGRERLFEPIMAANPDAVVAAAGTSCRHQIADATGKRPQHWAQVLADVVQ